MRKTGWREVLLGILAVGMSKVTIMGCYPLVPAYFAAVYLEESARKLVLFGTVLGMLLFLPLQALARYGMVLLVILTAVHMAEWVEHKQYAMTAAAAAGMGTCAITLGGQLLDITHRISPAFCVLEGIFIFGFVLFFAKGIHIFLTPLVQESTFTDKTVAEPEKLEGYAKIFGSLAKSFEMLGQEKAGNTEFSEELTMEYDSALRFQKMNQSWYNRFVENRRLIAEQLEAMAYIMEDCSQQKEILDRKEKRRLQDIRYASKEAGFEIQELHLYRKPDERLQLLAVARTHQGNCIASKKLGQVISQGLEVTMRPHEDTRSFVGREWMRVIFEEAPRLYEIHGIARRTKDSQTVSGDSFSVLTREDGMYYCALSDGMGTGARASQESGRIVDLLEKFLEAGFTLEKAIRLMNSAMLFCLEEDRYSTLDAAGINLYTGELLLCKAGGAATFIRHRDGSVEALLSTSLPVGANCDCSVEQVKRQLSDGDFLVMVTDGVLEYLRVPRPEEKMEEMIARIDTNHPGILARQLLEHVLLFTGGSVPDDMTVFATAVWEK